jgi:hypothetical protein
MRHKIAHTIFILLIIGCNSNQTKDENIFQKEYSELIESNLSEELIPVTNEGIFKFGVSCAFINQHGDTVIPFGRFRVFETDTLRTFTFVMDDRNGVVGINRKGEILFDAFIFGDVQLDSFSEGLIRILQNGKIGYADKTGKIIIKPKYKCAFPFVNGRAKVAFDCEVVHDELENSNWESNSWFYINRNEE